MYDWHFFISIYIYIYIYHNNTERSLATNRLLLLWAFYSMSAILLLMAPRRDIFRGKMKNVDISFM